MAKLTNELRDLIVDRVGRFTTDVLVGWEDGLKGKKRYRPGGRLFDREPPEHFVGPRIIDWTDGYRAALVYRERYMKRDVAFIGTGPDGKDMRVERKGWGVRRGEIVTRMERAGCRGDVYVFYRENGNIVRTVKCGI